MKFNTQNLALVIVFQLFIVGATLSITETKAGAAALACAIPDSASETRFIGMWSASKSSSTDTYGEYLTLGDIDEADFKNECKNYNKFRKVFRDKIKTEHFRCSGIGEECQYPGSPGCGISQETQNAYCKCEIEFTYCTQTSTSRALEEKFESQGKGSSR